MTKPPISVPTESRRPTEPSQFRELLKELVKAVTVEVNEKGAGGYLLARLSDARDALRAYKFAASSSLLPVGQPQAICPECGAKSQLTLTATGPWIYLTCGACRQWWSIGEIEHTPYFFGGKAASNGPNKVAKCGVEGCTNPARWQSKCEFHLNNASVASLPVGESTRDLHSIICQAVALLNQGDTLKAHTLLRQTLAEYVEPAGEPSAKCRQCKSTKLAPDPARYYVDAEIDGAPYYCRDCRELNVEALAHGGDHRDIINKPSVVPSVPAEIESGKVDELARELENRFMLYTLAGHKGSWLFQKLAEAAILAVPELRVREVRDPLPYCKFCGGTGIVSVEAGDANWGDACGCRSTRTQEKP